ncbi:hypothetical protein EDD52_13617 [Primorskyibacter sedentarius]|uniref:Uncharacterized protein n=1 Tax=Primorskyibacter sedentarius TaxID=745311 RepID=A0A4R3ITA7_9RHOB|nr:hypothetical protein EDD52_13617 [Primorskyibacter sedentarius]
MADISDFSKEVGLSGAAVFGSIKLSGENGTVASLVDRKRVCRNGHRAPGGASCPCFYARHFRKSVNARWRSEDGVSVKINTIMSMARMVLAMGRSRMNHGPLSENSRVRR